MQLTVKHMHCLHATALRRDIREVMAIIARMRLMIGCDSGVIHIADALKVPSVALFGPSSPVRWGHSKNRSSIVRALDRKTQSISADCVVEAAENLLMTDSSMQKHHPASMTVSSDGVTKSLLEEP